MTMRPLLLLLLAATASVLLLLRPAAAQNSVSSGGDFGLAGALLGGALPVFNANFSVNPTSLPGVGSTTNYGWTAFDGTDTSANQQLHQGLAVLNGGPLSWINVSTTTGPNSCGLQIPTIGGPSSSTTAPGWSFEFVWKPTGQTNTWAKLLDLGNGPVSGSQNWYALPNADDWTIGFDGNDQTQFLVETYNSNTLNYSHAYTQLETLQIGNWYHMVVVQTPAQTPAWTGPGGANWYIYVNGALDNWSYPLSSSGQPLSTSPLQGANYPQPVYRPMSYIGKSNWQADPVLSAVIDSVRIYDYALSPSQVYSLASLYALTTPPASTALNPTSYPPAGSLAPNFASIQTGAEVSIYSAAGISFAPVFNAPFSTNPASVVGGSTGYSWWASDPADVATGQAKYHTGLINMPGSPSAFVDLTQVTGPTSIGQSLPILFGPSSGSGASYGWSIELVVKPLSVQTWSKFFDLGTGAYIDSVYWGWLSNNNQWEVANYITVANWLVPPSVGLPGSSYIQHSNILNTPPLIGSWYHVAWVMQPQSTDAYFTTPQASTNANWTVYINGQPVVSQFPGNMPIPVFRHVSYLGRSDWFQEGNNGDAMINATYDAFRIWDRALTQTQVLALANQYGIGLPPTGATGGGDFGLAGALLGGALPVFNANFSVNPTSLPGVGSTTNYGWTAFDGTDTSANQQLHQGLAVLNGGPLSWINVSTTTGPNSCGLQIPTIGGPSSSTTAPGWSFEFVWKPTGQTNTWAKLLDLGNGPVSGSQNWYALPNADDWTIGFDGNDQTQFLVETYNSNTLNYSHAYTQLETLQIGNWYHMVVVQTPAQTPAWTGPGGANWYIYVNGALDNWSYPLSSSGQPLSTSPLQGANYPQPVYRPMSYIGKSNWQADPVLSAVIDSVRIYDYALSPSQVYSLASLYALTTPPASTALNPTSYPPAGSLAPNFASIQTGAEVSIYSAAGISFAPVFNAPFSTNPASVVGGSTGYSWWASDPADVATGQAKYHTGLINMPGSPSAFVDLTQVTGPTSIGQSLPILFGPSSGSGASYGWSIELVVKPLSVQTWSKFFDLGTGAYIDSVYWGWLSNNNQWEVANYITVANWLVPPSVGLPGSSYIQHSNILNTPPLIGSWYHVAWVMQPQSTDAYFTTPQASTNANWTVYINGQPVVSQFPGNMPIPVFRHVSYLGRSDWFQEGNNGDAMINATYDAFRIWDRALTQTQVLALANQYGIGLPPTGATGGGDFGLAGALLGGALPVFNANFSVNPTSLPGVGSTTNYGWTAFDGTDTSANQQLHQGLAVLNGGPLSWINVSTTTGPNSCGLQIPTIGGPSSSTTAPGWSFEFVWKPTGQTNTWAKLLDLGNGPVSGSQNWYALPNADDWTIGFDGNDQTQFLVETYNSNTLNYSHAYTQLETLQIGNWYHMVVVQTPAQTPAWTGPGGANWYIYVNGALDNWSYPLSSSGQPLSTSPLQGANYPQPVYRPMSYIGKSNWQADPVLSAVIDSVRIYDYALSPSQVYSLASLYALTTPPASTALNPTSYPPAGSLAPNFASIQTGAEVSIYSAAGISFAPVFNAPFSTNPASVVGGSTGYSWWASDPADVATGQAKYHTGLINMPGSPSAFVDLTQVTGPTSIGQSLPILFGPSSGSGASYGWSIELVVKPLSVQTWSKFFDLGTGAYIDSVYWGWLSNNNQWEVANYITVANWLVPPSVGLPGSSYIQHSNILNTPPLIGSWYHVAWVMQPQSTDAYFTTPQASTNANWTVYINGQPVVSQFPGNMPIPVFRHVSYLGRSDWFQEGNNGDAMINATYDAFRIWDRALTQTQVLALANQYGVGLGGSSAAPPAPASMSSSFSSAAITPSSSVVATSQPSPPQSIVSSSSSGAAAAVPGSSSSSSSGLSSGAIAGIVIGAVVGAALLVVLLAFCCCVAGTSRFGKRGEGQKSVGRYDEHTDGESRISQTTGAENQEVEMAEADTH